MLPPVSPIHFANRMERHWTDTLGNTSSDGLKTIWRQLGKAFGQAIMAYGKPEGGTWRVLQPPTGTGKTQGLCVYASMVAEQNARVEDSQKTGILIVTRLIAQCDEVVSLINDLAGAEVALARHSEARVSEGQMASADVLVITHQAYTNAVQGIDGEGSGQWPNFINWDHGQRKLTVIDEALANMVDERKLSAEDLAHVLGFIPQEIRHRHPKQMDALTTLLGLFDQIHEKVSGDPVLGTMRVVYRGTMAMPQSYIMTPLREAMWSHPYDKTVLGKESNADRHRLRDKVDATLKGAQSVMEHWAYYAKKGDDHTFNQAVLVIPEEIPGPVVLDATATQNFLWELFKERSEVYEVPSNARSYGNVSLHVARASGVGKGKMFALQRERVPRLLEDLEGRLDETRKVFLCCHKAVEPIAMTFAPAFASYEVGHWGAIDGRNDWKDCDVVVLFGLSYRDPIWANNTFMAFQGLQEDHWLRNPTFGVYADVRREMQDRQISVSVIQAINRVQCRKVIDGDGNCSPTDAFIVLPEDRTGDAILAAICSEMPGVRVKEWDFALDSQTTKVPSVRKGSSHEALVSYMQNQLPGEYLAKDIRADLEITESVWRESLAPSLRDRDHPLTQALEAINVTYQVTGKGRGAKSYLVKL